MATCNSEILKKANAAISNGDNEGFLDLCTENTVWTFVGERTLRGKQAVRDWMRTAYRQPPRFRVANLIDAGDFVTALGDIVMNDDDGNDVNYKYCDVWRFENGRMAELHAFVIKQTDQD